MKLKHKILVGIAVVIVVTALIGQLYGTQVKHALGFATIVDGCRTAAATTSFNFMTPGTGTTTLSCATASTNIIGVNAILLASSTAAGTTLGTRFGYRVERSNNNIDWYADLANLTELASTTVLTGTFADKVLAYASSTAGTSQTITFGYGGKTTGSGTTTGNFVHFDIPNPNSAYTRIVFYVTGSITGTATSTNGAVWAQMTLNEEHK